MPTYSDILNLLLPEQGDNYNVAEFNANWLKLEAALEALNDTIKGLGGGDYLAESLLGAANGIAQLDAAKKLLEAQLPEHKHSADQVTETDEYKVLKAAERTQLAGLKYGIAGGIPQLDAKVKIPLAYLYAAVANGLATLGADGCVPASQLNLTAAQVAPTTDRLWMTAAERTKLETVKTTTPQIITVTTADWPSTIVESTRVEVTMPSKNYLISYGGYYGMVIGTTFTGVITARVLGGDSESYPTTVEGAIGTCKIESGKLIIPSRIASDNSYTAVTGTFYVVPLGE